MHAILVVAIVLAAEAQAQSPTDWCHSPAATADQTIEACSAEIAAGPAAGYDLAIAYYNRALAYLSKGQRERAAADYDQAMRLEPEDSPAFAKRGRPSHISGVQTPAAAKPLVVVARKPPAPAKAPAAAKLNLAANVLKHMEGTREYAELRDLYEARRDDAVWLASAQGQAVDAWLKALRADAAATDIVRTPTGSALQYSVGGKKVTDTGILISDLQSDSDYRDFIANSIAANIVTDARVEAFLVTLGAEEPRAQ